MTLVLQQKDPYDTVDEAKQFAERLAFIYLPDMILHVHMPNVYRGSDCVVLLKKRPLSRSKRNPLQGFPQVTRKPGLCQALLSAGG